MPCSNYSSSCDYLLTDEIVRFSECPNCGGITELSSCLLEVLSLLRLVFNFSTFVYHHKKSLEKNIVI